MEKYRVQRISGGSMDELESNLRTFLNGLSDEEDCISLSLGLKEALIVTKKGSRPVVPPLRPVPVPVTPPAPASPPVFNMPVQPPQPAPEPVPPVPQPVQQAPAPEAPKTVQFIPKVEKEPEVEEVVDVEPDTQAETVPQRPDLIFRKCSYCNNQLIVPHVPISVMCPHCKSTVSIDE